APGQTPRPARRPRPARSRMPPQPSAREEEQTLRMTPDEKAGWDGDGFVVRQSVFSAAEVDELRQAAEDVAAGVKARATRVGAGPEALMADGHRIQFSSHAAIQWEWREGSEEIRVLQPWDHLHPAI